jgi:ABC-2 type transport system permease protein
VSAVSARTRGDLGRPVLGPTALGDDPRRFWRLTWTLAVTQFRLKFYGSFLGYLWQLVRPLMLFGVLYVVFTVAIRLGGGIAFFPVVLLTGIVLYTFFNEAVSQSVNALVDREPLLRKVEFPRMAIPCAVVLTALMNLGLNLVVVVFFAVISGVDLHLSQLQFPLILLALALFVLGIGLLTSALFVRYRDVSPISDVFLQIMFYGSVIIFPIEAIPASAQQWLMLNPFAAIIQQTRHAMIDPNAPSAFEVGGWQTGVAILLILLTVAGGFLVFRKRAPYVAEDL